MLEGFKAGWTLFGWQPIRIKHGKHVFMESMSMQLYRAPHIKQCFFKDDIKTIKTVLALFNV